VFPFTKPRLIYTEFMKNDKARCELDVQVLEADTLLNDKLLKIKLDLPFIPGTYRKVLSVTGSPITMSLVVKLEKNVFAVKQNLANPSATVAPKK